MKHIWLILFGVVVVAIAAFVLLVATLPTAKVTIQAIRPTGGLVTRTNAFGQVVSGPGWLFGITNVGRATASWYTSVHSRKSDGRGGFFYYPSRDWQIGILKPGEGSVTNLIVPFGDKIEWSAMLTYGTLPTRFHWQLRELGIKTPVVKRLVTRAWNGASWEPSWHPATNAPTTSSTATNTP
jgi:hypothetical protein